MVAEALIFLELRRYQSAQQQVCLRTFAGNHSCWQQGDSNKTPNVGESNVQPRQAQ